jgi:hypothetical protein
MNNKKRQVDCTCFNRSSRRDTRAWIKALIDRVIAIACFSLLFASACSNPVKAKVASEKAAADFHRMYDAEKSAEIYANADRSFKNVTSEKEFTDMLDAMHRKLGKTTSTAVINFNIATFNLVTTVALQYNTQFEKGAGKETFTFRVEDGKAVVAGYTISSQDLILK